MNRKIDRLSEERRQAVINDLTLFFENERDEKIGVLAAGQLLDFFLLSAGSDIYNKGISDAKDALEKRFDDFKYDLDDLMDL